MGYDRKVYAAKQRIFLEILSQTGNVTEAAAQAGLCRTGLYQKRERNRGFAEAWRHAEALGTEALEDECVRRAAQGWMEPVFYQGSECGNVRKYSDGLLTFLLKARKPEKYKNHKAIEHSGEMAVRQLLAAADGKSRCRPASEEAERSRANAQGWEAEQASS